MASRWVVTLFVDTLVRCVRRGQQFGAHAMIVDDAGFYRHFGFHDLDEQRLWRRFSDVAGALGA